MAYRKIGTGWDPQMRADIDTMFKELYDKYRGAGNDATEAREKAVQAVTDALLAKDIAETTRDEMTAIIREQTEGGDLVPEITQARGGHEVLGDRLNSINQELAQTEEKKADISYVNNKVQGVSLAFKESYATLTDLQNAYPDGNEHNHVVLGDGMIYTWTNGAWTNTQIQANGTGIADDSIDFKKISFADYGVNKLNPYAMEDGKSINTSGLIANDDDYSVGEYIPVSQGITYIINPKDTTFKRPAFYDINKNFVELVYGTTSTFPREYTPAQDGFIRVSVLTAGKFNISLTQKSVQPTFKEFEVEADGYFKTIPKDDSIESRMLKKGAVEYYNTNFLKQTENLFNKNTITPNKLILLNSISDSDLYDLSDFIPVRDVQSLDITAGLRTVSFFDDNELYKEALDQTETNKPDEPYTIEIPVGVSLMRISTYKEKTDSIMLTKSGTTVTGYVPNGLYMPRLVVKKENILDPNNPQIPSDNPLQSKKLLVFGDSIMAANFGVGKILSDKYNMPLRNLASGGATVAPREGNTNQIINRVQQGIDEGQTADYILFNGLTNDASVIPLERVGTITEGYNDTLDLDTFAGSFEHLVKTLITTWTGAKIIYIRPHNMDSRDDRQIAYGDLALEICRKWSIPYVDMYNEGGLNTQIPILKQLYTVDTYDTGLGDGTHPNEDGYKMYYAPRIEAKMKGI